MILYVSWGGSGWAASVRHAMRLAAGGDSPSGTGTAVDTGDGAGMSGGLGYLAILDDDHFADLDRSLLDLVTEELRWLLDAQLELTRGQVGAGDLDVEVVVRRGNVVDIVRAVVGERPVSRVLVGAPVAPAGGHPSAEALLATLRSEISPPIDVVEP